MSSNITFRASIHEVARVFGLWPYQREERERASPRDREREHGEREEREGVWVCVVLTHPTHQPSNLTIPKVVPKFN